MSEVGAPALDGAAQKWGASAIALHWLSAALVFFLLGLGWFMVHGEIGAATKFDLYQLHKSLGFVSAALLAARLIARLVRRSPQAPPRMPYWERRAAGLTHLTFYALLLAAFLSGWLLVSAAIIPIPTRFFNLFVIPNLVGSDVALSASMTLVHYIVSRMLVVLIILHIAAALKHHFIDRDDVLTRMVGLR